MTAEAYLQEATVSASQFFAIWRHYDADGDGYMDGNELQGFIRELQQARQKAGLGLTPEMKTFVDHFSKSSDGKIGIVEVAAMIMIYDILKTTRRFETDHLTKFVPLLGDLFQMVQFHLLLAQILPTEENFLLFFRCQQLKSSEDFMQTWRKYDSDHSGYIDAEELKNFLKDLLQKANKQIDDSKLSEYTDIMLKMFDENHDGKLELREMARLLPVQENFLLKFQGIKMHGKEFNKVFDTFDSDGNGYIDEQELDALLKDLCEKNKKELDINNLATYKKNIMALSDGGKLYRTELALILCAGQN